MGESHPIPGFGEVELEVDSDPDSGFGALEWELEGDDAPDAPASGARTTPASGAPPSAHEDSTRILKGDALSALTRSTAPPPMIAEVRRDSGATRQVTLDDGLIARARGQEGTGGREGSGSGVSTKDSRVAAMREAYARGDTEAALALAAELGDEASAAVDYPEASGIIEIVDSSMELSDPFGGLVPVEEAAELEEVGGSEPPPSVDPAVAALTLTQRHSIPRVVKTAAEIAKLPIDHRGGFLLGFIDGNQTLEEILDICAMPTVDALVLIQELQEMGVIQFE